MNSRSHTTDEIRSALHAGQPVWQLDTGSDGGDDVLIGERGETEAAVLAHFEVEAMPERWSLEPFTAETLACLCAQEGEPNITIELLDESEPYQLHEQLAPGPERPWIP